MVWAYRLAAISAALLVSGSASAAQQTEDCRAIADPARRLACYDTRESNPTQPPVASGPSSSEPARPERTRSASATPAPATTDPNRTFNSQIAGASLLRNGLYRIRLADGSEWTTSITGQRPKVGDKIHHRRTFIGTHYFDTETGRPLTVRPAR
ncbi:MAG: hypothetical protein ABI471_09580 [Sphingomonas bacterium]